MNNAQKAFKAIFSGEREVILGDIFYPVKKMGEQGLYSISTPNFLYIEQNPNKRGSKWAERARSGDKIIWVIQKPNKYVARVVNGEVTKLT